MKRRGFGRMRIRDSATVRRAVELGASFLDTADIYAEGDSERLFGEAFDVWPAEVSLGTKGGLNWQSRSANGSGHRPRKCSGCSTGRR